MKILIIHNQYQIPGGEDAVADSQYHLLKAVPGVQVEKFIINNNLLQAYSFFDKLGLFARDLHMKKTYQELERFIDAFAPDIAHIHNIYPIINPAVYSYLHSKKIKIVQTLHNYRFLCPSGSFFREGHICTECYDKKNFTPCVKYACYKESKAYSFLYAYMIHKGHKKGYFSRIDRFIALNEFMKEKMIDYGFDEDRFEIIPNVFSADHVEASPKKDYFLFIGRLTQEKGIKTVGEAFKGIQDRLVIMGGGGEEAYVQQLAEECSNIDYIGFLSGDKKTKIIQEAQAVIVPSEWYENLPTVIIEAFSLGTPVIVSRLGGAQYMVTDGLNGYHFKSGDIASLRIAIDQIKKSDHIHMSRQGIETYNNYYSVEAVMPKLLSLYRTLL